MPDTNTNTPNPRPPLNSRTTSINPKATPEQEPKKVAEPKEEEKKEPEPTLEEDYEALKNMNLLRNVMVRMQYGRYPNKKINAILERRMNFDESEFQGTHIVRIIISILAMFFICTFVYILIWLLATPFNFIELKETASLVISLFFLGSCGFAIFNNISVPDEKKLKEAIKEKMSQIENEIKKEKKK